MILVADSGSTKTDWRLIDDAGNNQSFKCSGFNPFFHSSAQIADEIEATFVSKIESNQVTEIFYYGAGCSNEERCTVVRTGIQENFPNARIHVEHDLLGAARALCGDEPGIATILGTGSNSCYYDGREIKENRASLGYILGDEGSGAYIGKKFLQAYLNKELPKELAHVFFSEYKLDKDAILKSVYSEPNANRFMASFTLFVFQHFHHPFLHKLVSGAFADFFDHHVCKYELYRELKLHCTGSVGYYFSSILKSVANTKGVVVGKIIETPITALALYHAKK
jgi:N-acetylglucosamine kinase-like BadF-type ATPase